MMTNIGLSAHPCEVQRGAPCPVGPKVAVHSALDPAAGLGTDDEALVLVQEPDTHVRIDTIAGPSQQVDGSLRILLDRPVDMELRLEKVDRVDRVLSIVSNPQPFQHEVVVITVDNDGLAVRPCDVFQETDNVLEL